MVRCQGGSQAGAARWAKSGQSSVEGTNTKGGFSLSGKGDQLNAGRGSMKVQIRELPLPPDVAPF